ncbi:MAG: DUF2812 domain-containing protein [Clostridia bacterium]|nr:DUF2812 domain-containing protein [Clostridia bacterium]MBO4885015.1 DUF2812 domain-containing protein [Clostridia bacterium]
MAERKTLYKWFWVWEFEKEEEWLNEMAMKGWALDSVGFCRYTFEKCEPGEYNVRLEMHGADQEYIDFMKDTGAEYVGRMVAWIYFRKKATDGPFDLFSDIDSRIEHLKRISWALSCVCGGNLLIGFTNTMNGFQFAWINLLCAAFLAYGLGRIHGKKEALERERRLRE